jgi:hypothetical protein
MFWKEEHGRPHLHARKYGRKTSFDIRTGEVIVGRMSKKDAALVKAWIFIHQHDLVENWRRSREDKPLKKIAPLG